MTHRKTSLTLPSYKKPPVVEVVLSLQFKPLAELRTAQIGRLWKIYEEEFPQIEDHPLLDRAEERFEQARKPSFEVKLEVPNNPPRCWFVDESGNHVIQVQRDRFILNWRKSSENDPEPYPRYQAVRAKFDSAFRSFVTFVAEELRGVIEPDQAEVTYINHIPEGRGWTDISEMEKVVTFWRNGFSDDFLVTPEGVRIQNTYLIPQDGKPVGRLHADLRTAKTPEDKHVLALNLTARGLPLYDLESKSVGFFDVGHEWVVRGFTSMTTAHMHRVWERQK